MEILLATRYTDKTGYTPIHISTTKYRLFSGNSMGIRPGALFLRRFHLTRQRLQEAGLISFWTDDVLNSRKILIRKEQRLTEQFDELASITQDERQVVLGVQQLLGAFLMLAMGSILACLFLIAELFGSINN
ncbi:hypothetical protein Pmani_026351 [Petrolisthes manimaculis]|uniref:Uncharacterized protein n=1 Tax=Petrolisthes manimaculis TaxID=1843537 RepID=A0AAE1P4D7_9EUCA|nr:hypothetical protein Pmani_026351 [Petrolisthes manimaculis]